MSVSPPLAILQINFQVGVKSDNYVHRDLTDINT